MAAGPGDGYPSHRRNVAGEEIVFVGVTSAHRGSAFAAGEFIMDYLAETPRAVLEA